MTAPYMPEEGAFLLRVHQEGHGELHNQHGFVATAYISDPEHAPLHYAGSMENLATDVTAHVMQWYNGTKYYDHTFVSVSETVYYALFEGRRRDIHSSPAYISAIDPTRIQSDMWLASDLVIGTDARPQSSHFARRQKEVLVYGRIPAEAVVATITVDSFFECLPRWCSNIKEEIHPALNGLWSVAAVTNHLQRLASIHNSPAEKALFLEDSVKRSMEKLRRSTLPSVADFDKRRHADAVDKMAKFAICWWPECIIGHRPSAYAALLQSARNKVVEKLEEEKKLDFTTSESKPISRIRPGVVRTEKQSPRKLKPYVGIPSSAIAYYPSIKREEE